jgi:cellulose synthase/poly-beta-1,6-N-acetylglucosamine synthase-like glycosyltransferase
MWNWLLVIGVSVASLVPVIYLFVNAHLSRRWNRTVRVAPAVPSEITIVIPVHAEPLERFRTCVRAACGQNCRVVVAGDGSTEPYRSVARTEGAEFLALPEHGGKKRALAAGLRTVRTPFVLFVDSDTILPPKAAQNLSTYFEPSVGGVGANLFVRETDSVAARCAEFVERAREVVLRAMSSRGNVLYLDGACMMYRTDLVRPYVFSDEFQNLAVLGRPTPLGDDWLLTDHVLAEGYRTVKAYDVAAVTDRPENLRDFVRQNVRWSRSSWIRLGRYLRGLGPEDPGLFYRLELAGTYALPLLAFALGLLRLPLYLHLFDHLVSSIGAAAGGILPSPAAGHSNWYLRGFFSTETIVSSFGAGTFIGAVATRLPPGRRGKTLSCGILGSAILLFTAIYGLLTFWCVPEWRARSEPPSPAVDAPAGPISSGTMGPVSLSRR